MGFKQRWMPHPCDIVNTVPQSAKQRSTQENDCGHNGPNPTDESVTDEEFAHCFIGGQLSVEELGSTVQFVWIKRRWRHWHRVRAQPHIVSRGTQPFHQKNQRFVNGNNKANQDSGTANMELKTSKERALITAGIRPETEIKFPIGVDVGSVRRPKNSEGGRPFEEKFAFFA